MSKIDINKHYRTRDGREVMLHALNGPKEERQQESETEKITRMITLALFTFKALALWTAFVAVVCLGISAWHFHATNGGRDHE